MTILGKTKIYGLLGDPVAHSVSPLMQNEAFRENDIDAVYVAFHVAPAGLSDAVAGLRALNVAGFNVTVPHKENIIPLLDEVDPFAELIGAVNTVVNSNGCLKGFNTDASGFKRTLLEELNFKLKGATVAILGAGGASRAAAVALASEGVQRLLVANRSQERAEKLVKELSPHFDSVEMTSCGYDSEMFYKTLPFADLVVQTTSAGLDNGKINFLPLECIKSSALIYDMIYSLSETSFIREAKEHNFISCDGLAMLAAQGEDAFALWTGIHLETGFMKRCLEIQIQSPLREGA